MTSSLLQGKRFFCREWAFSKISHCLENRSAAKTCGTLVVGGPGCGKTALCCETVWPTSTLGKQVLLSKRILAYYFCQAHDIETLSLLTFIQVLVEQLSKTSLVQGYDTYLEEHPDVQALLDPVICEGNPDETFKRAVLLPLRELPPPSQNLFVIVDSVDESYLQYINDRTEGSRTIAELLANNHQYFPPWLLLVCSARKQSKTVTRKFTGFRKISLDDLSKSHVVHDVQQYILCRLDREEELRQHLSRDTAEMLNQLHIKSNGCFLYLERVLDGVADLFIKLREITDIPGTLNGLYLWLCQRIFTKKQFDQIRPILNVILAARRPLTDVELFSCAYTRDTSLTLEEFQQQMAYMSKILIEGKEGTKILFHHSFAEWLLDVKHCTQKYLCTAAEGHGMLAMSFTMHAPNLSPVEIQDFALHIVKSNMPSPLFDSSQLIQWLIQSGANIEESLSVGLPKEQAVLQLLMEAGAKLPIPAESAVIAPKLVTSEEDALQLILKMGTPIDAPDSNGRTMLHNAAHEGNLQAVKVLLGKGAHVEVVDRSGQTALNIASKQGHAHIVHTLIKAGAKVDHIDAEGWTSLRSAAWGGHSEVVNILLQSSALVDQSDGDGRTALRAAAWGGHDEIVLNLLNNRAEVNKCDKEGRTPLIAASYMGHADIVRHLIQRGADINHEDIDGRTALSVAALCIHASEGHGDVVRILLENKAEVDHEDKDGMTPLIVAAYEGHREVCEQLLEDEADVDHTDHSGRCALQAAVSTGHTPVVELLMFWGCYTDMIDTDGRTVLCLACQQGNVEVVRLLLDRGMDELHRDNAGWTPMHFAAFEGHKEVMDALLEVGAKLTEIDNDGRVPLILAAQEGHLAVVQRLTEAGTDIECKGHDGKTALRAAALEGHKEIVDFLLAENADVNYKDADGRSTLYVLALENNLLSASVLLEHGTDVSGRDFEGRTTLHVAAWQGHYDMVRLLLKHGADVSAVDNDSRSVLQSAAWQGHAKVVRLLLENGADVDQSCDQGATALCIASQEGHEDVVKVLLEFHSNPNHADQCGRTATRVAMKGGHSNVVRILEESGAAPSMNGGGKHSANSTTTSGISMTIDSKASGSQGNSGAPLTAAVIRANLLEHNLNGNNSAYESPGSTYERRKSCLSNNSKSSGNATNTGSTNHSSCSGGIDVSSLPKQQQQQPMTFTQQLQQCSRNKNRPVSKTLTPVSEPYSSPIYDNTPSGGSPVSDVVQSTPTAGPKSVVTSPSSNLESPKKSSACSHKVTSPRLEYSSSNISPGGNVKNVTNGQHGSSVSGYQRSVSMPTQDNEPVWQRQTDPKNMNAAKLELQRRGTYPDMPPMAGSGIAMGQMSLALKSPETRRKRNGIVTNPKFAKKTSETGGGASSPVSSANQNVRLPAYSGSKRKDYV